MSNGNEVCNGCGAELYLFDDECLEDGVCPDCIDELVTAVCVGIKHDDDDDDAPKY